MSFIESELLQDYSYGFQHNITFENTINMTRSKEDRNNETPEPRFSYTVPFNNIRVRNDNSSFRDIATLQRAIFLCRGDFRGFRIDDKAFNTFTDDNIGSYTGLAIVLQARKFYTLTIASETFSTQKTIRKPNDDLTIEIGGTAIGPGDFSVDTTTGLISINASLTPTGDVVITAGTFAIPVRFDSGTLSLNLIQFNTASGTLEIVEDPNEDA